MRGHHRKWIAAALGLSALARPAAADELLPLPQASGAGVIDIDERACDPQAPDPASMVKVRLAVRDTLRRIGPYVVSLPAYSAMPDILPPDKIEPWGPYQVNIKPGQTLRIDLVDNLQDRETIPANGFPDQKLKNDNDKAVNLHTHGLIVEPRPYSPCGTLGDYIFSAVDWKATASYRIKIPERVAGAYLHLPKGDPSPDGKGPFPVGPYWIHSHFHGLAKDAVLAGQSAFLSVDCARPDRADACPNGAAAQHVLPEDIKVLALRDVQIVANADHTPDKANSPGFAADVPNGYFAKAAYDPTLCEFDYTEPRKGVCFTPPLTKPDKDGNPVPKTLGDFGATDKDGKPLTDQANGVWLFTVNGQLFPTVTLKPHRNQIWRLANMSGVMTYRLNINKTNDQTKKVEKVPFEIVSVDGVLAGTPTADGFTPNREADELLLMPGARAEIRVKWQAAEDGDRFTLENQRFCTGITDDKNNGGCSADPWPGVTLAQIDMQPAAALMAHNLAASGLSAVSPFTRRPVRPDHESGFLPANCLGLPKLGYRTIRFEQDGKNFFIGPVNTDEGDDQARLADVHSFRHDSPPGMRKHICVAGGAADPRRRVKRERAELWLLENDTEELHNFHIHQSKFRLATPKEAEDNHLGDVVHDPNGMLTAQAPSLAAALQRESAEEGAVWHDSIPVPPRKLRADGSKDFGHIAIVIPFNDENQVGTFVYHCHILEHEDGGMMGVVEVYSPLKPRLAEAESGLRSAGFCGQPPAGYTPIPVRNAGWRDRLADLIGL